MRLVRTLLLLVVLGGSIASLQHSLTAAAPVEMWPAWAVDVAIGAQSTPVESASGREGPDARAAILRSQGAAANLSADALTIAANQGLQAFRTGARANVLCSPWTCPADSDESSVTRETAQWARDRIVQSLQRRSVGAAEGRLRLLARNAERGGHAAQALSGSLLILLGLCLVGVVWAWQCNGAAWPFLGAYVVSAAAALAHQAVALNSFDLRNVQVEHLLHGVWLLPAGLLMGLAMASLAARASVLDRLAGAWVSIGPGHAAWLRGCLLAAATGAWIWVPPLFGMRVLPAVQMEGVLAIASFALATFMARNLAWTEATGQPTAFGWPVVAVGVLAALGASLARSDGGALALTLGLALSWVLLTGPRGVVVPVAVALVALWSAWMLALPSLSESTSPMPPGLASLTGFMPHRIAERVAVAWTPFGAGPSDVARMVWLSDMGGLTGFGFASPVEGLAAGREADRRLLQLTADYMPAVLVSVYGAPPAAVLLALHAGLLLALAAVGIRSTSATGTTPTVRLLAFWGAFGLLGAVLRTLLSTGGALGVLPLTGVPVPGLSLGSAAALATGLMGGLALGPVMSSRKVVVP